MPGVVRRALGTLLSVFLITFVGLVASPAAFARPGPAPAPTPAAPGGAASIEGPPARAGAVLPGDSGVGTDASMLTTVALGVLFAVLLVAGRRRERVHHPAAE